MSKLVAFGRPEFYIAPYDKSNRGLVNLSSNCDVKSGLRHCDSRQAKRPQRLAGWDNIKSRKLYMTKTLSKTSRLGQQTVTEDKLDGLT